MIGLLLALKFIIQLRYKFVNLFVNPFKLKAPDYRRMEWVYVPPPSDIRPQPSVQCRAWRTCVLLRTPPPINFPPGQKPATSSGDTNRLINGWSCSGPPLRGGNETPARLTEVIYWFLQYRILSLWIWISDACWLGPMLQTVWAARSHPQ